MQFTKALTILLLLQAQAATAQFSKTPGFLYMVARKGDTMPSFLMGTLHHLGADEVLKNKRILSLVLNSKTIVLEADTTELFHPAETKHDFNSKLPLDELLGFADYQMVQREFLKYTGQDLEKYRFKMPLFILDCIQNGKRKQNQTGKKKTIMESAFIAVSRLKNIPVRGLESREEYYKLMYESMPLNEQAKLLLLSLRPSEFYSSADQMKYCWDIQDLNCLCSVDDMKQYSKPGDSTILVKRNLFWLPKILGYLDQKQVFIAVGAAHLCGDYGLIALLKKYGYSVIPLTTKSR